MNATLTIALLAAAIAAPVAAYNRDGSTTSIICMSVEEVTEWAMPANNAISFTAKFKSPESGEVTRMWFEMTRNSRGEWLFTRLRTKA